MVEQRDLSDKTCSETSSTPHRATARETASLLGTVLLPTLTQGVIKRRPWAMWLAERAHLDRAAIQRMTRLRRRHDGAPLLLSIRARNIVVPLDGADVARLLDETPVPFSPASREKRAALDHFQPHGVLVSDEPERAVRREFTEAVLESGQRVHQLADHITAAAAEEAQCMLAEAGERLDWNGFNRAWWRLTRRIVLGEQARDDSKITDMLDRLRRDANWAFARPRRRGLRRRFHRALLRHLERAEPGSLAALVARAAGSGHRAAAIAPSSQVAHWLFAFDAAGMTTFRALALLASHPEQATRVRGEHAERAPSRPKAPEDSTGAPGDYLRACLLETVRLWPTTPLLLRESTQETRWGTMTLPSGTRFSIFVPFFHRDRHSVPAADEFVPERWLGEPESAGSSPACLVPFSAGPAHCPGQNLVLLMGGALLSALVAERDYRLVRPSTLRADQPLPATLNSFGIVLAPQPARAAEAVEKSPRAGAAPTQTHLTVTSQTLR